MPLLQPSIPPAEVLPKPQEPAKDLNENVLEVLKQASVDQRRGKSRMAPLLVEEGLGLEEIARKLHFFSSYSDDETIQFNATKLALQLHGELEKEGRDVSPIQINFVGVTPELFQVLIPRG